MSHLLDSPGARRDPRLNITDQYVFGTSGATVFVLNAGTSLAGDENPSRFHAEGRYEIKVHLGGRQGEPGRDGTTGVRTASGFVPRTLGGGGVPDVRDARCRDFSHLTALGQGEKDRIASQPDDGAYSAPKVVRCARLR